MEHHTNLHEGIKERWSWWGLLFGYMWRHNSADALLHPLQGSKAQPHPLPTNAVGCLSPLGHTYFLHLADAKPNPMQLFSCSFEEGKPPVAIMPASCLYHVLCVLLWLWLSKRRWLVTRMFSRLLSFSSPRCDASPDFGLTFLRLLQIIHPMLC